MPNGHGILRRLVSRLIRRPLRPMYGAPLTDVDGNVYKTVNIGEQTWMAENLRVTHFRDGSDISHVTDNDHWAGCNSPAYCFLANTPDPAKQAKFGALYNLYAALYSPSPCQITTFLAPEGWRLPTYYDWAKLEVFLVENHYYFDYAGEPYKDALAKALASKTGWKESPIEATPGYDSGSNNTTLFNAMPLSWRVFNGEFGSTGTSASWWRYGGLNPDMPNSGGCIRQINYNAAEVIHGRDSFSAGHSIRLVKE